MCQSHLTPNHKKGILQCLIYCYLFGACFLMTTPSTGQRAIRIGMTTALSGPNSNLGKSMRVGIEAYFKEVNAERGLSGRRLVLVALDDGYQPTSAASNMRKLIHKHKVVAIIGNAGTPTAKVTVPIANREKVLLFGAFTGAKLLRKTPPDRYVINFRASYEQELAEITKAIVEKGIKSNEIAFFTQADSYGNAGYNAAIKALEEQKYTHVNSFAHGRYTRNTIDVEEGLLKIFDEAIIPPRAILMVGTYAANAKFIKMARKIYPEVLFMNISFVDSQSLAAALAESVKNNKMKVVPGFDSNSKEMRIYITQVVPDFNSELKGVVAYRKTLQQFFPEVSPNFVSLEGYLAAKVLVAGLKKIPRSKQINRENTIDAIESIKKLDIGIDKRINYSKSNHQGLQHIWRTQIVEEMPKKE